MTEKSGYIYILINPSQTENLKIGRTSRDTEKRKKELSNALKAGTGVASDFVVAYDELVDDCVGIENKIHKKLEKCRVNKNKEFFKTSLKIAIKTLMLVIDDEQNNKEIDFSKKIENENLTKWKKLDFNHKQLIRSQISLINNLAESELLESLRNIIDFSFNETERKIVLDLYKNINYHQKSMNWFKKLPNHTQQMIKSYSDKELTKKEFDKILNLTTFACQSSKFITKLKPLTFLKNLRSLDISHTKIAKLTNIDQFKELTEIHFNQTEIDSLLPLKELLNLKKIFAIGTKIEQKDIDYFTADNNDCKIETKSFMDN